MGADISSRFPVPVWDPERMKSVKAGLAEQLKKLEPQQSARFEEMDTDNNGRVTRDELTKGLFGSGDPSSMSLADYFRAEQLVDFALQRHDLDGDGAISVKTSPKRQERINAQQFKGYDLDGDGQVTKQELRNKVDDDFLASLLINAYDLDCDGKIDVPK